MCTSNAELINNTKDDTINKSMLLINNDISIKLTDIAMAVMYMFNSFILLRLGCI